MEEPLFSGKAEISEMRSAFLFLCLTLTSEAQFESALKWAKATYPKAKHILYAYRVQTKDSGLKEGCSENGEPVKAAHKVLFALQAQGVTDKGIIAVRHYGGKKLGAAHLEKTFVDGFMKALAQSQMKGE